MGQAEAVGTGDQAGRVAEKWGNPGGFPGSRLAGQRGLGILTRAHLCALEHHAAVRRHVSE